MQIETGLPDLQILIEEYFSTSDYKAIETIFRGEKGTKVLEIFVDNKDGINIDDITVINKELNALIDSKYISNDISNLVVSSPGAERPLRFIWQLHKHSGRVLELELNDGEKLEGKLTELVQTDDGKNLITLEVSVKEKGKKSSLETRIINFEDIKELRVKLSFSKK